MRETNKQTSGISKNSTIRLPMDTYLFFSAEAKKERRTLASYLRIVLEDYKASQASNAMQAIDQIG